MTYIRRLQEQFELASELPPEQQSQFLEKMCLGESARLIEDLRQLLALAREEDESDPPLESFDGYELVERVGEGAFGLVYRARQTEPVCREVAIKILKLGRDSEEILGRFQRERQALALMQHPFIAGVYDAGLTPTGQSYFVMEFVRGIPLNEYCDQKRLDLPSRQRLLIKVCQGVQHAHQKGIIHRDLKPTNILIAEQDGEANPRIIDFGVAKASAQTPSSQSVLTEGQQLIGTPEYMSPEQASMAGAAVDTRSDVYSLGVILYELLTGVLPFDPKRLRGGGYPEIQRIIREVIPPRPSTRFTELGGCRMNIAKARRCYPEELGRRLRGDLDWIVLTCLEKEPERRYGNVQELALDLERYLNVEPVVARPATAAYRLSRFLGRHRWGALTAALIVVSLSVAMTWALIERSRATRKTNEILQLSDFLHLDNAIEEAHTLWPAGPDTIDRLSNWLEQRAHPLQRRRRVHKEILEQVRASALPPESELTLSTIPRFNDPELQWQHDMLVRLVDRLQSFSELVERVEERLRYSTTVEELSVTGDDAALRWRAAIEDIRSSELYSGLELRPQLGLVPLRADPESGLWEFWHMQSGDKPQHNSDPERRSSWNMSDTTGFVLVLLPGGRFLYGSQNLDPAAPNYHPELTTRSDPYFVDLCPFFISKYEVTVGQWNRIVEMTQHGRPLQNLSPVDGILPAREMNWSEATNAMSCMGMRLPTSKQWEYAGRGATSTTWWTGNRLESLAGAGNLGECDKYADWCLGTYVSDGHDWLTPIGLFRANPYGLHDTIGNVWEWCRDPNKMPTWPDLGAGGEFIDLSAEHVVQRGGSAGSPVLNGGSALFLYRRKSHSDPYFGFRPIRPVER